MYMHNFWLCINAYPKIVSISKTKLYIDIDWPLTLNYSYPCMEDTSINHMHICIWDYLNICLIMYKCFFQIPQIGAMARIPSIN
jgi:hypothetical protein